MSAWIFPNFSLVKDESQDRICSFAALPPRSALAFSIGWPAQCLTRGCDCCKGHNRHHAAFAVIRSVLQDTAWARETCKLAEPQLAKLSYGHRDRDQYVVHSSATAAPIG